MSLAVRKPVSTQKSPHFRFWTDENSSLEPLPIPPLTSPSVLFNKVAILGMGLLGGSLGKALRRRGLASCVAGYARRHETVQACLALDAAHVASTDPLEVVQEADLVVLCTPVCQMAELARLTLPHLSPNAVVTDVGSTKAAIVSELEPLFAKRGISFVGGHPMAGSDQSGVAASKEDLYVNARCVVTPTDRSPGAAVSRIRQLWEAVGGRVQLASPKDHDQWAARASHLPHLLASSLAHYTLDPLQPEGVRELCATGFRDTTRLANGSPEMWRDIALTNRDEIRLAIQAWTADLAALDSALADASPSSIERYLQEAKERREAWLRGFRPNGSDNGSIA